MERAIAAAARKKAREAKCAQGGVPGCAPRQGIPGPRASRPADLYQCGAEMARHFMRQQLEAGRTAGQIEATHEYVTGPWRAAARHSAGSAQRFRGYAELVAARVARLREAEAAGLEPQPGMEPALAS